MAAEKIEKKKKKKKNTRLVNCATKCGEMPRTEVFFPPLNKDIHFLVVALRKCQCPCTFQT